jgi:hypothetical protein
MSALLFSKLFELQKLVSRKTDLVLAIAEEVAHVEANSHRFNVDRTRLHSQKREFEDLCAQINSLAAEIESDIATTV